ncbi:MAG: autotransporter assembly complex protein TamA [Gammaproteobacteria bacterium]
MGPRRRATPARRVWIALLLAGFVARAIAGIPVTVEVQGIQGALRDNVLAVLSIEQQKEDSGLTEARLRQLFSQSPAQIRTALEPFGYYRPIIHRELDHSGQRWIARLRIDPGPALRIRHLEVDLRGPGRDDPKFKALIQSLPLHTGERLVQSEYTNAKEKLEQLAAVRGYLDAAFTRHEIAIDLQAYHADVFLVFDTGPRYRFGPVSFQQGILDPRFLRRYLPFHDGQFYSTAELQALQTALSDSDYFSQVEVRPRRDLAQGTVVPIQVQLKPRPASKYTAGIGYGTDTGARISLGWERRYLNRYGHRADATLKVSQIGNSLTTRYIIPLRKPLTDQFVASAGINNLRTSTSVSHAQILSATVQRVRGLLQESLYLNFQHEQFRVGDQSGSSLLLMPGVTWRYVKSRGELYSLRGYRLNLDVHGSLRNVGSDATFLQALLQGKSIYPLFGAGRVLLRGELGLSAVPQFSALPASQRFFAGGAQSVRGYAYQALGPVDASGQVIGGRYLIVGSIEYEHQVWRKWGIAAFYDAGNAMDSLHGKLARGAGFGIRWHSPVGPVRLDLAWALDSPGTPMRVQVSMGPDL